MKKYVLFILAIAIGLLSIAQERAVLPKEMRNLAVEKKAVYYDAEFKIKNQPPFKSTSSIEEEIIGKSFFDLQSNSSMQNRIYLYPDGTVGATYTFGNNHPGFDDRGSAYNYFDGSVWGPLPTERLESDRTGWVAYAPLGENGEIAVSHLSGAADDGLLFNKRSEKGTGVWDEFLYEGPVGNEALTWPRMTTAGIDNNIIHLIGLTLPEANGGTSYQGQDGAILYSRSSDGGITWDIQNHLFEELNQDFYHGFDGDTYDLQAQGDNVAFVVGEPWIDMILMKSTDGGVNWTKTIIWENPYPMWNTGTVTDTFFCVDGAHSLAFDPDGMVHIAFGINRGLSIDGTAQSWFPFVDGVGYWNESMPVFSNDINALEPYGHPDSELIEDVNLIGWSQDMDGDGEITFIGNTTDAIGTYQLGLSSMPQLHIDEMGYIYVMWSSVTETYENGLKNYRHLWVRSTINGGEYWGDFYHLTYDIIHIFDESVWPALSKTSDDQFLYMLYQIDSEPGLAVRFEEHAYVENTLQFMKIEKWPVGINEVNPINNLVEVSQNFPNPFSGTSIIRVELSRGTSLTLEILNLLGQRVLTIDKGYLAEGTHDITISADKVDNGTYFYKVITDNYETTKKMIIE